jgi:hypothetical protein
VYTREPIGERPANIEGEQADWQGVWIAERDGSVVVVNVVDGSKGILRVGWLETNVNSFRYVTADVFLREGLNWRYANVRIGADEALQRYHWARIEKVGSLIILWFADAKTFVPLMKDGTLPASAILPELVLGDLASSHFEIIEAEKDSLFLPDDPLVLVKVSNWISPNHEPILLEHWNYRSNPPRSYPLEPKPDGLTQIR